MTKRPPNPARRSTVPAPQISLQLAKTAQCCKSVVETLAPAGGVPLSTLVSSVSDELSTKTVGTSKERVVQNLSALAWKYVTGSTSEAEADFSRLCSIKTYPHDSTSQAAALRRAGIPVEDVTPNDLAAYLGSAPVQALLRIRKLEELTVLIRRGDLSEKIGEIFDTTQTTLSLEDMVSSLSTGGIDAEKLCWALITFETNRHINLVWHFANKLTKSFPDRIPADLFGWGWQGLRVALRNFDPELGFAFSTYAGTRISGAIRDGVRSESPVPKRLTTYLRKVVKAEEDLTQGLGRAPRLEEVAAHLGEDLEQLSIIPRLAPAASIDELTDESRERHSVPHWLVDNADPANAAVQSSLSDAVEKALLQIPLEDQQAIRLLVMEGLDPKEAREITGVDSRKMRRYKERGLAVLAEHLSDWESSQV